MRIAILLLTLVLAVVPIAGRADSLPMSAESVRDATQTVPADIPSSIRTWTMLDEARSRVDRFEEVLQFCDMDTLLAAAAEPVKQRLGYIDFLLGAGSALSTLRTYRLSDIEPVGQKIAIIRQKFDYAIVDSAYTSWRFTISIEPGEIQPNMGLTDSSLFFGAIASLEFLDSALYNKLQAAQWDFFAADSARPHLLTFILEAERGIRTEAMLVGILVLAAQNYSGHVTFEMDASILPVAFDLMEQYGIRMPTEEPPVSTPGVPLESGPELPR